MLSIGRLDHQSLGQKSTAFNLADIDRDCRSLSNLVGVTRACHPARAGRLRPYAQLKSVVDRGRNHWVGEYPRPGSAMLGRNLQSWRPHKHHCDGVCGCNAVEWQII